MMINEFEGIPARLRPYRVQLRGKPRLEYPNLSKTKLTVEEMVFFIEEILEMHHLLPRTMEKLNGRDLAGRYSLDEKNLSKWKQSYLDPNAVICSEPRRPGSLDEISQNIITIWLEESKSQRIPPNIDKLTEKMNEEKRLTAARRTKRNFTEMTIISDRLVQEFKRQHKVNMQIAQNMTKARHKALYDIRLT